MAAESASQTVSNPCSLRRVQSAHKSARSGSSARSFQLGERVRCRGFSALTAQLIHTEVLHRIQHGLHSHLGMPHVLFKDLPQRAVRWCRLSTQDVCRTVSHLSLAVFKQRHCVNNLARNLCHRVSGLHTARSRATTHLKPYSIHTRCLRMACVKYSRT